jgi:hypothetical protein
MYLISSDKLLLMIEEGPETMWVLWASLFYMEFSILFLHGLENRFVS